MSHFRNLKANTKFKVAGEGFFFPVVIGDRFKKVLAKKKKLVKANTATKQTFKTLGDMLLKNYVVDFMATLKGDKVVITGGELGEWRLTQYTNGTIYSQLQLNRPNNSPISIEHNCGPDPEAGPVGEDPIDKKWVWSMTPGEDRRRRLCNHCKKRVPETIRGLIKLIE